MRHSKLWKRQADLQYLCVFINCLRSGLCVCLLKQVDIIWHCARKSFDMKRVLEKGSIEHITPSVKTPREVHLFTRLYRTFQRSKKPCISREDLLCYSATDPERMKGSTGPDSLSDSNGSRIHQWVLRSCLHAASLLDVRCVQRLVET